MRTWHGLAASFARGTGRLEGTQLAHILFRRISTRSLGRARLRRCTNGLVKSTFIAACSLPCCQGTCNVLINKGTLLVATLSSGSFFGEATLLFQTERTATVQTKTYCKLLALTKGQLEAALKGHEEEAVRAPSPARAAIEADKGAPLAPFRALLCFPHDAITMRAHLTERASFCTPFVVQLTADL